MRLCCACESEKAGSGKVKERVDATSDEESML